MTNFVPVTVTARLRGGVSYDPPFGLDLAGILAAQQRMLMRAAAESSGTLASAPLPDTTEEEADDYDLPLERCVLGADWHWSASCVALEAAASDAEPRPYTRSADVPWAAATATLPLPLISGAKGPYRDARMPAPVTPAGRAVWQAVGDPGLIAALLRPVHAIGRRRHVGEGVVLDWTVTAHPDEDPLPWAHLDRRSHMLHRPVPPECAAAVSAGAVRESWYAIRPPSWHPDRLQRLVVSAGDDEW